LSGGIELVRYQLAVKYLQFLLLSYEVKMNKVKDGYCVKLTEKDSAGYETYYGNSIEDVLIKIGEEKIKGVLKKESY
jgi:hypothetical protein